MLTRVRRWWPGALVAAVGVWYLVADVRSGHLVAGLVGGLFLLAVAVVLSPSFFPRSPGWADGERRAEADGVPLILWKPNCSHCVLLRLALGTRGRAAVWVDLERDARAAAETRLRNDGNETTPTVIAAGGTRTNPPPAWVRAQLSGRGRA